MKALIIFFLLSTIAIAGLLYQELTHDPDSPAIDNRTMQPDSAKRKALGNKSPVKITEKPVRAYKTTLTRPLFSPTRRPQSEQKESPIPVKKKAKARNDDKVKLTAIIITPETKEAMLTEQRSRTVVRVKEGETFGEWTLTSIEEDKIVMSNGESSQEFHLHSYPPAPTPRRSSKKPIRGSAPARKPVPSQSRSGPVSLKKKNYSLPGKGGRF